MPERNIILYLDDIKDSIRNIEEYIKGLDFDDFTEDRKTIDAVVRNLEIIGEAAVNISRDTKAKYPDIPWRQISNMRNKIAHEYFGVDLGIVWKTIKEDIPKLKKEIKKII